MTARDTALAHYSAENAKLAAEANARDAQGLGQFEPPRRGLIDDEPLQQGFAFIAFVAVIVIGMAMYGAVKLGGDMMRMALGVEGQVSP